jgi:hypothetical protein
MNIFIYFSTYLIFFGFLYYFKIISYNPFLWLLFAFFISIGISIYVLHYNDNYYELVKYLFYNSPKLLLLLIIDKIALFEGFIFYSLLFIIYIILLYIFKTDLYTIYYTKTIIKIIENKF